MKIGELARNTGTAVETIRYYEREGLLPAPARSEGNYRIYGGEHLERLTFIRHCRLLDMTHEEIRALLRLKDAPHEPCADVNRLLDRHIEHVCARIHELRQLEAHLLNLRQRCTVPGAADACGILRELSQPLAEDRRGDGHPHNHVPGTHPQGQAGHD